MTGQKLEMLHVQGDQIVTPGGSPIHLRGTCVGGWMNMESFIDGYPGSEHGLRAAMAEILGASRAEFLFDRWLDHFFNENDVAYIRQCGANVVRLPLNYRHFERDDQPFRYLESGFHRLEQAVRWCEQHNLYVILDIHAAPGWQNPDWHSDNTTKGALLWQHPHFQDRFVALWQEIACRYQGRAVIAGYDLLNEPLCNEVSERLTGVYRPDWALFNRLYRRAVETIRGVDPDHIIFLEGDGFASRFLGLDEPFAGNLAYSSHNYNRAGWGPGAYPGMHREGYWDRRKLEEAFLEHEGTRFTRQVGAPLWVGEFGSVFNGPPGDRPDRLRGLDDQIGIFEQHGAHWTTWTYKDLGVMGWVNLDPDSPYMRLVKPVLEAKLEFLSDSWMYWLPSTPSKELLGDLAGLFVERFEQEGLNQKHIHGRLVRMALTETLGSMMQPLFACKFKDMSDNEIDDVFQSFRLERCKPNADLVGIVTKHMKQEAFSDQSSAVSDKRSPGAVYLL